MWTAIGDHFAIVEILLVRETVPRWSFPESLGITPILSESQMTSDACEDSSARHRHYVRSRGWNSRAPGSCGISSIPSISLKSHPIASMGHPHLTKADRSAQATRGLFVFRRAENERGFLYAHVMDDVRIPVRIGFRFL